MMMVMMITLQCSSSLSYMNENLAKQQWFVSMNSIRALIAALSDLFDLINLTGKYSGKHLKNN